MSTLVPKIVTSSNIGSIIVKIIHMQCEHYMSNPTEDNLGKLATACLLLVSGMTADAHPGGAKQMLGEIRKQDEMLSLLDPDKRHTS